MYNKLTNADECVWNISAAFYKLGESNKSVRLKRCGSFEFCNIDKRHLQLIRLIAQTSKCVFGTSAQTTSHHGCKS